MRTGALHEATQRLRRDEKLYSVLRHLESNHLGQIPPRRSRFEYLPARPDFVVSTGGRPETYTARFLLSRRLTTFASNGVTETRLTDYQYVQPRGSGLAA